MEKGRGISFLLRILDGHIGFVAQQHPGTAHKYEWCIPLGRQLRCFYDAATVVVASKHNNSLRLLWSIIFHQGTSCRGKQSVAAKPHRYRKQQQDQEKVGATAASEGQSGKGAT